MENYKQLEFDVLESEPMLNSVEQLVCNKLLANVNMIDIGKQLNLTLYEVMRHTDCILKKTGEVDIDSLRKHFLERLNNSEK